MRLVPLGRTPLQVTRIGLGCWQFSEGGGLGGSYWTALPAETENRIVAASLQAGINWFDTAEVYGAGRSEAALARALLAAGKRPGDVVIATKWMPLFRTARSVGATVGERLARLAPFPIDLHQVHQPIALSTTRRQMNAMADLVAGGRIWAVGVSNFSARRMRLANQALAERGIPLASNQVRYNLLDRRIERNGVLEAAKELGVTVIAYSPLAQGILTGKFHRDPGLIAKRSGPRKWMPAFRRGGLERSGPLVSALEEIGRAHGASASQVALAWLLEAQGDAVVVIPGASTVEQAEENARAADLTLTGAEFAKLDALSRPLR